MFAAQYGVYGKGTKPCPVISLCNEWSGPEDREMGRVIRVCFSTPIQSLSGGISSMIKIAISHPWMLAM